MYAYLTAASAAPHRVRDRAVVHHAPVFARRFDDPVKVWPVYVSGAADVVPKNGLRGENRKAALAAFEEHCAKHSLPFHKDAVVLVHARELGTDGIIFRTAPWEKNHPNDVSVDYAAYVYHVDAARQLLAKDTAATAKAAAAAAKATKPAPAAKKGARK